MTEGYDRSAAAADTAAMAAAVRRRRREAREAVRSAVPEHVVRQRFVFGVAGDCDVRVTGDVRVAGHHAILSQLVDGSVVIEPLPGGAGATYVLDPGATVARPIDRPTAVERGGAVVIGSAVYPWRKVG